MASTGTTWINDPASLFNDYKIFPSASMTRTEKFNTLIRMVILVALLMFLFKYKYTSLFVIIMIVVLVFLYFLPTKQQENMMSFPKNSLVGRNEKSKEKMNVIPVIAPRAYDGQVFAYPSTKFNGINEDRLLNITDEYEKIEFGREAIPISKYVRGYRPSDVSEYCENRFEPQTSTGTTKVSDISTNPNQTSEQLQIERNKTLEDKSVSNTTLVNELVQPTEDTRVTTILKERFPKQDQTRNLTFSRYEEGEKKTDPTDRYSYFQQVQPEHYSLSDTIEPINSNIGITYTPSLPPRVLDQVMLNDIGKPLYHRVDPQLIRDGGMPPERIDEMPRRTAFSAKYNMLEANDGSVNYDDIYNAKFEAYQGGVYKKLEDINLGNVQYYYSDTDAYKYPMFERSKVDFINYVSPMGKEMPEYMRNVSLEDIRNDVESQYTADTLCHRMDIQERLMRKRNSEEWQLRQAPIRRDARLATSRAGP